MQLLKPSVYVEPFLFCFEIFLIVCMPQLLTLELRLTCV